MYPVNGVTHEQWCSETTHSTIANNSILYLQGSMIIKIQ